MKHSKTIFLLVLVQSFCVGLMAQSKREQAVLETVESLRVAMINADKDKLEAIASEQLSYGHSSGYVEGKKEFVEKIVSGKSDFVTIELSNQTLSFSGKTAIVRHDLAATTNDGGKAGTVKLKVLLVFQLEHKTWKLLARQAVKIQS